MNALFAITFKSRDAPMGMIAKDKSSWVDSILKACFQIVFKFLINRRRAPGDIYLLPIVPIELCTAPYLCSMILFVSVCAFSLCIQDRSVRQTISHIH